MIVLKFNRPLSAEDTARIREQLDAAIEHNGFIVVDNSVEVFTDEAAAVRFEGLAT